ncbi:hypothetical protein JZ751_027354 [Albula glossodonta]|uniref:Uncharacterized protein n=1 Tax=Albula glossodonta TaxID=121402 RepID=A0A8T2MNQ7_9TELE|nr:hypothetical protein JZ751_027354 [Albula glossodonta]
MRGWTRPTDNLGESGVSSSVRKQNPQESAAEAIEGQRLIIKVLSDSTDGARLSHQAPTRTRASSLAASCLRNFFLLGVGEPRDDGPGAFGWNGGEPPLISVIREKRFTEKHGRNVNATSITVTVSSDLTWQAPSRAPMLALDVSCHLLAGGGGVAALQAAIAPSGVLPKDAAAKGLPCRGAEGQRDSREHFQHIQTPSATQPRPQSHAQAQGAGWGQTAVKQGQAGGPLKLPLSEQPYLSMCEPCVSLTCCLLGGLLLLSITAPGSSGRTVHTTKHKVHSTPTALEPGGVGGAAMEGLGPGGRGSLWLGGDVEPEAGG